MARIYRNGLALMIGTFAASACTASRAPYVGNLDADQRQLQMEINMLINQGTADSLATAALLSPASDVASHQPLALIERAEILAPGQPELVWAHAQICRRQQCAEARAIERRLEQVAPDNGFAWMSDLESAESAAAPDATTEALLNISAAPRLTFYWNALEVMMVDRLMSLGTPGSLTVRSIKTIGVLSGQIIPPLNPFAKPCRLDQFIRPGRREACESLVQRLEHSDAVIVQGLALSIQERWWPTGSAERESLRVKRRLLDYEIAMSSKSRWRTRRDMAIRLDAARRSDREEDVMHAVMDNYGIPRLPPDDWRDARDSGM